MANLPIQQMQGNFRYKPAKPDPFTEAVNAAISSYQNVLQMNQIKEQTELVKAQQAHMEAQTQKLQMESGIRGEHKKAAKYFDGMAGILLDKLDGADAGARAQIEQSAKLIMEDFLTAAPEVQEAVLPHCEVFSKNFMDIIKPMIPQTTEEKTEVEREDLEKGRERLEEAREDVIWAEKRVESERKDTERQKKETGETLDLETAQERTADLTLKLTSGMNNLEILKQGGLDETIFQELVDDETLQKPQFEMMFKSREDWLRTKKLPEARRKFILQKQIILNQTMLEMENLVGRYNLKMPAIYDEAYKKSLEQTLGK